MMLLDEATDLWCDCSAVPTHQEHLANGPVTSLASAWDMCQVLVTTRSSKYKSPTNQGPAIVGPGLLQS